MNFIVDFDQLLPLLEINQKSEGNYFMLGTVRKYLFEFCESFDNLFDHIPNKIVYKYILGVLIHNKCHCPNLMRI